MKLARDTLIRKSLCEIRYRDTNGEVAAFMAYELTPAEGNLRRSGAETVWTCLKRFYEGVTGSPVTPFSFLLITSGHLRLPISCAAQSSSHTPLTAK